MALLTQSIFSRLAGYDDTNHAQRLCVAPAMRQVVGEKAKGNSRRLLPERENSDCPWLL